MRYNYSKGWADEVQRAIGEIPGLLNYVIHYTITPYSISTMVHGAYKLIYNNQSNDTEPMFF